MPNTGANTETATGTDAPAGGATFPSTVEELRRAPTNVWQDFARENPDTYAELRDELLREVAAGNGRRR